MHHFISIINTVQGAELIIRKKKYISGAMQGMMGQWPCPI